MTKIVAFTDEEFTQILYAIQDRISDLEDFCSSRTDEIRDCKKALDKLDEAKEIPPFIYWTPPTIEE